MNKHRGFTIVELLIVIVVIAILAAITIVAYNGIQVRAKNSQTISMMTSYLKAVKLFQAEKGYLPENGATSDIYRCFGENYPANKCGGTTNAAACGFGGTTPSTAFGDLIRPYFSNTGTLPPVTSTPLDCPEGPIAGALYVFRAATQRADIYYFLNGDSDCSNPAGLRTYKNTYSTGITRCYTPINQT